MLLDNHQSYQYEVERDYQYLKDIIYTNWNIDPKDCKEGLTGFEDSGISIIEYYDALKVGNKLTDKYPMHKCVEDSVAVVIQASQVSSNIITEHAP
mmetsp:Transcript_1235/g.1039  ORF Transcript_1235/g.1039 Transcript_1235/m.1039 type:complete len:96 (-) Transcript_1235:77-364(-)